jgi:hypothetical protein
MSLTLYAELSGLPSWRCTFVNLLARHRDKPQSSKTRSASLSAGKMAGSRSCRKKSTARRAHEIRPKLS